MKGKINMIVTIETAVDEFKEAERCSEPDLAAFYLKIVRTHAKRLFKARHIPWNDEAETLLQECIDTYSIYAGCSFLAHLTAMIEKQYGSEIKENRTSDYYSARAYRGTGLMSFEEKWTSNPEALTMERVQEQRKGKDISE